MHSSIEQGFPLVWIVQEKVVIALDKCSVQQMVGNLYFFKEYSPSICMLAMKMYVMYIVPSVQKD